MNSSNSLKLQQSNLRHSNWFWCHGSLYGYKTCSKAETPTYSPSYPYQSLQCGQYQEHWRKNSTSGQYSILHLWIKATFNVPDHNVGQAGSYTQTSRLEEINPNINWRTHKLLWRTMKTIHNIYSILSYYPPSDDQLIASLKPKFAKEEHELWNKRKMNKATLLTYCAEKKKVEIHQEEITWRTNTCWISQISLSLFWTRT